MGSLYRIGDALVLLGLRIAQAAVAIMFVLITAEVFARALFGRSLLIVNEFAGYLLMVMTFFGCAYSLRKGALLRIEVILFALPLRVRRLAEVVFNTLALVLVLFLLRYLISFTWSTWNRGMVAPTLSEIPLWLPQMAMPLGCGFLVVALLLELSDSIARWRGKVPEADRQDGRPETLF